MGSEMCIRDRVAAEAERAQADGGGDCGGDGSNDRGERSTAVDLNQDDLSSVGRSSAAPSKKGTKGKKKVTFFFASLFPSFQQQRERNGRHGHLHLISSLFFGGGALVEGVKKRSI